MTHGLRVLGCLFCLGCASSPNTGTSPTTVLVASSLGPAFDTIADLYEAETGALPVRIVVAGTQTLAMQLRQGMRANLIASANPETLRTLQDEGLVHDIQEFASGSLVVASRATDPTAPTLETLPSYSRIAIADPAVPLGRYTATMLNRGRESLGDTWYRTVQDKVVSREISARWVTQRIDRGEVDAAIVYRSDAQTTPSLQWADPPAQWSPIARYELAHLSEHKTTQHSRAFFDFILSPSAQNTLRTYGFSPPSAP